MSSLVECVNGLAERSLLFEFPVPAIELQCHPCILDGAVRLLLNADFESVLREEPQPQLALIRQAEEIDGIEDLPRRNDTGSASEKCFFSP